MMRNPYMDYFGRSTPQYYSAEQVQPIVTELRRVKALAQQQQNQIDSLQAKLQITQRALKEWEAQPARPTADHAAQITRLEGDLADWQARYAALESEQAAAGGPIHDQTNFLLDVLPFVDNLERALAADPNGDSPLHQGIELTLRAFHTTLAKLGVTPIKVAGEAFDPHQHEAVGVMSTLDAPEGTITQVEQTGYAYGDRLLRPARVIVAGGTNA
jgi:molecular chaperone GrpE